MVSNISNPTQYWKIAIDWVLGFHISNSLKCRYSRDYSSFRQASFSLSWSLFGEALWVACGDLIINRLPRLFVVYGNAFDLWFRTADVTLYSLRLAITLQPMEYRWLDKGDFACHYLVLRWMELVSDNTHVEEWLLKGKNH